jgi:hypothetical protein
MTQSTARTNSDYEGYRLLWANVLLTAIKDMDDYNAQERKAASDYVFSPSTNPTSFRWICTILNIHADTLQTACMTREFRVNFSRHKLTAD